MMSLDNDGSLDDSDNMIELSRVQRCRYMIFFESLTLSQPALNAVQDSIAKEQILAKYVQLTCRKPCHANPKMRRMESMSFHL